MTLVTLQKRRQAELPQQDELGSARREPGRGPSAQGDSARASTLDFRPPEPCEGAAEGVSRPGPECPLLSNTKTEMTHGAGEGFNELKSKRKSTS